MLFLLNGLLTHAQYATDFFQAIVNITSGLMLPLTTADLLAHAIVGSVLENLDMERLIREVGQAVSQRILGNNESVDDVARELHERLLLRNESTKKVVIESIYRESEEAKHNVSVYMQASNLAEARPQLKRVSNILMVFSFTVLIWEFYIFRYRALALQTSTCTRESAVATVIPPRTPLIFRRAQGRALRLLQQFRHHHTLHLAKS